MGSRDERCPIKKEKRSSTHAPPAASPPVRHRQLVDQLEREHLLKPEEFLVLLTSFTPETAEYLFHRARAVRRREYGRQVYIRGLIEFTSYCKNNCYYCGLRRSNRRAERYRLTPKEILDCCKAGWELGFRTFVLQGGEDPGYSPESIAQVVRQIKTQFPECAVTLSCGEWPEAVYRLWRESGADRYLLRHETANAAHYARLHPSELSLARRKECLWTLKKLGYQVGAGFMVGAPDQTAEHLVEDLLFLYQLRPAMIGIGPFLPHHDTPFADRPAGDLSLTLFLLGVLRLMFPAVLLPATTALGTVDPKGREKGMLAGANVVMPNLSPSGVRKKYLLYDNKACTGMEAAEHLEKLSQQMRAIGYEVAVSRGDSRMR